ncbi:hypothetical protein P7K49_013492 [Saguinus oedipus]|uniref:Uncharacterized protein n=1 Tax=Saguinus oedipus TaxID=9490 RepID=A0ABQ9VGF7_SAGOE|nr:hypothetical protein P7K49_013492 [Saguinus oedipus]
MEASDPYTEEAAAVAGVQPSQDPATVEESLGKLPATWFILIASKRDCSAVPGEMQKMGSFWSRHGLGHTYLDWCSYDAADGLGNWPPLVSRDPKKELQYLQLF